MGIEYDTTEATTGAIGLKTTADNRGTIEKRLDELEAAIATLGEQTWDITKRIDVALGPDLSVEAASKGPGETQEAPQSTLANRLEDLTLRVRDINRAQVHTYNRIEL